MAGFLLLQGSLAALMAVSLWAVFGGGGTRTYRGGAAEPRAGGLAADPP